MKKTKLIPIGIAACFAVGLYCSVSGNTGDQSVASIGSAAVFDNSFIDSVIDNILGNGTSENDTVAVESRVSKKEASVKTVTADSNENDNSSEIKNRESDFGNETFSVEEDSDETDSFGGYVRDEAVVSVSDNDHEAADFEDPAFYEDDVNNEVVYEMRYDIVTDETDVSEIDENDSDIPDNTFEKTENTEIRDVAVTRKADEEDSVTGKEREMNTAETEKESSEEDNSAAESTENTDECDHVWNPVTETVHHDAKTHTEKVTVSYLDNNISLSYCDADRNDICNVFIHRTLDRYENDVLVSSESYKEEGTVEIKNLVTGEEFIFAPGELESYESFVNEMFDGEVFGAGALIGPAYCSVEDRDIVDEEAYDEEVIKEYTCDVCGVHKD